MFFKLQAPGIALDSTKRFCQVAIKQHCSGSPNSGVSLKNQPGRLPSGWDNGNLDANISPHPHQWQNTVENGPSGLRSAQRLAQEWWVLCSLVISKSWKQNSWERGHGGRYRRGVSRRYRDWGWEIKAQTWRLWKWDKWQSTAPKATLKPWSSYCPLGFNPDEFRMEGGSYVCVSVCTLGHRHMT